MPDMPPKEAEAFVRLAVNLPVTLHSSIRATAVSKGQTISEYVRAALEDAQERDRRAGTDEADTRG